ncbi:hypothetical protein O9929_17755 [Vibrio lentus]|nr:hypothetical protein [Vibrio lentus]
MIGSVHNDELDRYIEELDLNLSRRMRFVSLAGNKVGQCQKEKTALGARGSFLFFDGVRLFVLLFWCISL